MSVAFILLIIGVLFNLFLGVLVALKHHDKAARALAVVAVGLIEWEIANYFADEGGKLTLLSNRLAFIGPLVVILASYFFVIYLRGIKARKHEMWLLAAVTTVVAALSLTPLIVPEVTPRVSEGIIVGYNPVYGKGYLLFIVWTAFLVILHLRKIFASTRNETPQYVAQMHIVRMGTIAALIVPTITNLILPNLLNSSSSAKFVPLTSIVYMGSLSIAILRHKMLDIRSFVVRAAAYSFTTLVLALLYVGPSMFIFMKVMDLPFKPLAFAASVVLGTLVAMNYQRIKTWFNRATNKIFFRDVYDPTLLMSELNKSLLGSIDPKKLLASAEKIIAKGFNPEYCYFLLTPQEKTRQPRIITSSKLSAEHNWLIKAYDLISSRQRNDILLVEALPNDSDLRKKLLDHEVAISIRLSTSGIKNEVLGYVLLGVRKSGKPYDVLDAQVLGALANTLTIAMQNALHFEEIQKFNATLQEKVDGATRKLRTTNEKLKKLDETKDEFISMASHQLRTPLTSVKGYLSMVLEGDAGPLKPQQEELLKQSYMSSQRMVNLIADLLDLSRLNTGKFVIDAAPTDLRVVVDQEVSQLRESAKSKQIQVNWEMPASFSLLQLDEGKIHQVVMNFIDNALYYTPVGGTVDISLSEVGSAIEFRVKDSGIGVPREMQHKLFGKFFRADNARRMRPDGTGLGLYMAKKVVLAQGGSIIFESREGKGSTFGFRFSKSSLKPHSEQP